MNARGAWWMAVALVVAAAGSLAAMGFAPPPAPAEGDAAARERNEAAHVRFTHVDVFVDPGAAKRLAAWQVEYAGTVTDGEGRSAGTIELVGVEGGEKGSAFEKPGYYDPAALAKSRVIVAGFSTEAPEKLPVGRVRVARLHVRIEVGAGVIAANAKIDHNVKLMTAGDEHGERNTTGAASAAAGENP